MKLPTAAEIAAIDRAAIKEFGMSGLQLMENAGRGAAEIAKGVIVSQGRPLKESRVAVFAGRGNNGGDGYVIARHLKNSGVNAAVYSLSRLEDLKQDAAVNFKIWKKMGGGVYMFFSKTAIDKYRSSIIHSHVLVDALFGTGLNTPVGGVAAEAIRYINSLGKSVVSVDVPSGIDASTGAILGCAVRASVTATMSLPKRGLYLYPGRDMAGEIRVVDIGAPAALLVDNAVGCSLITRDYVSGLLRPRMPDTHKGIYGHVLLAAGSPGHTGAAYMAAMGAMRIGAGLATIALPKSLEPVMEANTVEVMTIGLPQTVDRTLGEESSEAVKLAMLGKSAIVIGPGIGRGKGVSKFVEAALKAAKAPVVVDADGLYALAGKLDALKGCAADIVLTPHPGEASWLLGVKTRDIQADRVGCAATLAKKTGAIVVLKGASTVIADPDGEIFINPTGNAGLSTAGAGDVLAGMIGGLCGQGYDVVNAAIAAVYIHGLAADEIKKEKGEIGMIATDLLPVIPRLMNSFVSSAVL
ncbi:MAG: NAD(P)H-hydrate dehydratase [Deltaproteobacteria bacterium]|nr:NAD(P)H-hydrate dehydratase [Deltaproteobacteria bacterium]